jgi:hypothetical protein
MHDANTWSSTSKESKAPRARRKLQLGLALVAGVAATAALLPVVGSRGSLEIRDAAAFSCTHINGNVAWNCAGPIAGWSCTRILEPSDRHTWNDNYFCALNDIGAKWSYAGPIGGMRCTRIVELSDPDTWNDNYLCVPPSSPYLFQWSMAGPIPDMNCLQWEEPSDPDTWNDNYLCWY